MGYFVLDLVSSIPFGLIFNGLSSFNKLLRIFKLPRLVRMTKVSKLVKFKNYYKGTSLSYFVRIHGGLIKTIMLGVVTLIMLHLATCVWCFIGKIESDAPFTWIDRYKLSNASNFEVYLTGLYFCLVSLTTVGYGDYTAYTNSSPSSRSRDLFLHPLDAHRSRLLLLHHRHHLRFLHRQRNQRLAARQKAQQPRRVLQRAQHQRRNQTEAQSIHRVLR